MRTAFFAGSFNPFTPGHADIVERGLRLFHKIVIGIGVNNEKPGSMDTARRRLQDIAKRYAEEPRVSVMLYSNLTVEAAREAGACCLLRGARSGVDFEYERNIADANRLLDPDLDTVILPARPNWPASRRRCCATSPLTAARCQAARQRLIQNSRELT